MSAETIQTLVIPNYDSIVFCWILVALVAFILLFYVDAPYGRFQNSLSVIMLPPRYGWILLEAPTITLFPYLYIIGKHNSYGTFVLLLWLVHYVHRTLIYPLVLLPPDVANKRSMSIITILCGTGFQMVNCLLLGVQLFHFDNSKPYNNSSLSAYIQVSAGVVLFIAGLAMNIQSDSILRSLKKRNMATNTDRETNKHTNNNTNNSNNNNNNNDISKRYFIPRGGMFDYVSCANYFGEIVEWFGFALLTWSTASVVFFVWTLANLVPRAVKTHKWYNEKFGNKYPKNRKAIFPFVW